MGQVNLPTTWHFSCVNLVCTTPKFVPGLSSLNVWDKDIVAIWPCWRFHAIKGMLKGSWSSSKLACHVRPENHILRHRGLDLRKYVVKYLIYIFCLLVTLTTWSNFHRSKSTNPLDISPGVWSQNISCTSLAARFCWQSRKALRGQCWRRGHGLRENCCSFPSFLIFHMRLGSSRVSGLEKCCNVWMHALQLQLAKSWL